MMFKKTNKGGSQSLTPSSGSSSLSTSGWATLPINSRYLHGISWKRPVVLDAALTACAHGSLSPGISNRWNLCGYTSLPLAALVSLTITYKLEKATELPCACRTGLGRPCCRLPWPCMPIVTSLWTQKVKLGDFLIFSASRTVFHHNSDAVIQLLEAASLALLV
ncbi:hypothetical protein Bca52824_050264 [Brassica carinata]|uniref:Uncharacterized protein n=1 Tax=Brassica carinata TaxID=52824 RepID=A0A8X7RM33_BRACI|nr:hypothetical protein Bca52824_050264 [Brassica carinata]